jgi:dTDP-4-amino-4,6-dideoxygalactose transaminase
MAHLADRKIGCVIHYPAAVHRQSAYAGRAKIPKAGLPVTERLCERILTLPMYPELSDDEIDQVIAGVRSYFRR